MEREQLPNSIFRALVHFAPDGFLVVDASGEIVFANVQAEVLFGYVREELIGMPVEQLIPQRLRSTHESHRDDYRRDPKPRAMGSRIALVARRRDGSELPVEVSLAPVYSDDTMYVSATVRDVAERRAMEEVVRQSEERYRLLAEHAVDVVYRLTLKPFPHVDYISPSVFALTGYQPEEFYADPELMHRIAHPDDLALFNRFLTEPDTLAHPVLLRSIHRDGHIVWHEQRFSPVHDFSGAVVGIEGIARDVTEQRLLEEERRLLLAEAEIERERDRISADLHDGVMQTMYSVGLRLSSVLRQWSNLSDEQRAEIGETVQHLDSAIGDIRRYIQDLQPLSFNGDLGDSMAELVDMFGATSGITTSCECAPEAHALDTEQAIALFLLAREALSNIRRHSQAQAVDVRIDHQEGSLVLRVVDDGVGFDVTSVDASSGHFGLRNMETRARSAGGQLEIESAPGKGTTVRVTVPITTEHAVASHSARHTAGDDQDHGPLLTSPPVG